MKKKVTLCFWILQMGYLSSLAQTNTKQLITILNEYGDTLKPKYVRYKRANDTKPTDCVDCKEKSGIVNLSKLTEGTYTLQLGFEPPVEFSIQIPLEKDTLVVSTLPKSIVEAGEPSQVITAEQLALSGKNTLEEALVYLLPSFYASWQIMADKSEFFTPTSMKGMGPDQFLILINGKRRHATSVLHLNGTFGRGTVSNDLVNIPISAVKAIEVKNAASSVWHGSDAIAGVINIQLHDSKPTTSNFGIQGGFYPSGLGHPDASGVGQWWTKEGLGNEKEGKIHLQIFQYFGKDKKGFLSLGGDLIHLGHINRTGNYPDTVIFTKKRPEGDSINDFWNNVQNSASFARHKTTINGRAAVQQSSAYFNLETPINHAYFYAFGGFSYKTGDIVGFYRLPKEVGKVNLSVTPYGYSPHLNPRTSDYYLTTGLKFKVSGLGNLDVAYSTGGHVVHNYLQNTFNVDLSDIVPDSNATRNFYAGANFYRQQTIDIQSHKLIPIDKGVSHLDIISGILLRKETFGTIAGEESAYYFTPNDISKKEGNTQQFPSFHPDDAVERDRNNYGAFLQGKLAYLFNDNLTGHVTLGGRYEAFSNFKGQPIYKAAAGLHYSGDKNETDLRVSWNQGFRTPSLHQIYFKGVSSQYRGANPNLVYIGSNQSLLARAIGIQPLEPETATSWNIGGSWRDKSNHFELKIDYSHTVVNNRIVLSTFDDDTAKITNSNLKDRNITSALFFRNYPTTTTQSIDVSFHWNKNTALQFIFGLNWNQNRVSDTANTDPKLKLNTFFDRQETSRYENVIPNFKSFILLHGRYKQVSYKLQATIFGQNAFIAPLDPIKGLTKSESDELIKYTDQVFKNQREPLIDIELGYHVSEKAKLAIGCNNLLDFKSNKIQSWEKDVLPRLKADGKLPNNKYTEGDLKQLWDSNVINYNLINYSRRVQTYGVGGIFIYAKFTYSIF